MWIETVVLSARQGYEARLHRMLKARCVIRRNSLDCVKSWLGDAVGSKGTFLLQALYKTQDAVGLALQAVSELDQKDGGLESVLEGPPLVGIFEVDDDDIQ